MLRQQTLTFAQSGRIDANRPGPRPKAPTTLSPAASAALIHGTRRRRKVGGVNEAEVIEAFRSSRAHHDAGEPDSDDSQSSDDNGNGGHHTKKTRQSYSREKKLQAINYFELTDMPGKQGEPDVPISLTLASTKLKLDRKCLREWKKQKLRILRMKKGAKRWRGQSVGREPLLEFNLHSKFVIERGIGRIISSSWFIKHAKVIYRELYPRRFSQDEVTGRFEYDFFSFSKTWFLGFRRRYRIVLRCKTK
jgi:hypothetical protein